MKIRIRKDSTIDEGRVEYFLEQEGVEVILKCIGVDGGQWRVAVLKPDGTLSLSDFIGSGSGLKRDKKQRIELSGDF